MAPSAVIPLVGSMMNGESLKLEIRQQQAHAKWALSKATVFEFVSREKDIF
jgi:hypothetical protein